MKHILKTLKNSACHWKFASFGATVWGDHHMLKVIIAKRCNQGTQQDSVFV